MTEMEKTNLEENDLVISLYSQQSLLHLRNLQYIGTFYFEISSSFKIDFI